LVENIIITIQIIVQSGNTVRNYYYGFLRWKKWEKLQGISDADVLPAKPIHVALYLTCLVQQNSSSGPIFPDLQSHNIPDISLTFSIKEDGDSKMSSLNT
jgi:hypothetical protein